MRINYQLRTKALIDLTTDANRPVDLLICEKNSRSVNANWLQ